MNDISNRGWRDVLPVHPAADLFPLMSETELRELGEDIRKNGLQNPIVIWAHNVPNNQEGVKYSLLDGRNRLDAMELVGIEFTLFFGGPRGRENWIIDADIRLPDREETGVQLDFGSDPYDFVISANAHRRHLTAEKKRNLIAKLLKATPEKSDRAIATIAKTDHKTVGAVRAEKEGRGEIPHVETRTDSQGRKQPAQKGWSKERWRRHKERKLPTVNAPNALIEAWDKSGPRQRQDFILARKVEVMRAQAQIGKSAHESCLRRVPTGAVP